MRHHGGMKQHRAAAGRSQGVEHHQRVVDGQLRVAARGGEPPLAVVGRAHQPARRGACPDKFEHRLSVGCPAAHNHLPFVLLPQLLRERRRRAALNAEAEDRRLPVGSKRCVVLHQRQVLALAADCKRVAGHLVVSCLTHRGMSLSESVLYLMRVGSVSTMVFQ